MEKEELLNLKKVLVKDNKEITSLVVKLGHINLTAEDKNDREHEDEVRTYLLKDIDNQDIKYIKGEVDVVGNEDPLYTLFLDYKILAIVNDTAYIYVKYMDKEIKVHHELITLKPHEEKKMISEDIDFDEDGYIIFSAN